VEALQVSIGMPPKQSFVVPTTGHYAIAFRRFSKRRFAVWGFVCEVKKNQ
jgi:hypothetical protein